MSLEVKANSSAIRETVQALMTFIKENNSSIAMVLDHFPAPNEVMTMPALTVMAKNPKFMPCMPYVISKSDIIDYETSDQDSEDQTSTRAVVVRSVVGSYDFGLQLDLWTAYKPQRDLLFESLIRNFNMDDVPGITLKLDKYFEEFCHYSIDGRIQYVEDEASAQRGEWRAIMTVVGSIRCVIEKVERVVETIENTLETPPTIATPVIPDSELII